MYCVVMKSLKKLSSNIGSEGLSQMRKKAVASLALNNEKYGNQDVQLENFMSIITFTSAFIPLPLYRLVFVSIKTPSLTHHRHTQPAMTCDDRGPEAEILSIYQSNCVCVCLCHWVKCLCVLVCLGSW